MTENKKEIINKIEKILLNWQKFDKERVDILLNFKSSFQVQACPWSWKTTLLVAKLMFLAQTIDFSKESICVLTHTNVAIDEIKKKIKKCNIPWYENFINNLHKIFEYPNFVWTIQSFLDKYLWIPWYTREYKKKPNFIWDEFIDKFNWIHYNVIEKKLETKDNKLNQLLENTKIIYFKNQIQIQNFWKLSYKEIDYFSLKYLQDSKIIKLLIQKRFKYIFLDEIQDTHSLHTKILNWLYDNWENNIIQWFWDYNQEIFNEWIDWWKFTIFWNKEAKKIDNSLRLSSIIAENVKNICIEPQKLIWIEWRNIPIYFIIFNKNEPEKVIGKYIKIIEKHKKDFEWIEKDDLIFKAIWWNWKEDDEKTKKKKEKDGKREKLYIWRYWKNYNNWKITKTKNNLFSYFQKVEEKEYKNKWFSIYKDNFIKWILHSFNQNKDYQIKTSDNKYFSKTKFLEYLKENNLYLDFQNNIYIFAKQIENKTLDWEKVRSYILNLEINSKKIKDDNFLKNKIFWTPDEINNLSKDNLYSENGYKIQFSTIAKAKGETHTWTLVLDTDYSSENTSRILRFWKDKKEYTKWWDIAKSLRNYYVAITRATHLLCISICEDNLKKYKIDDFLEKGVVEKF